MSERVSVVEGGGGGGGLSTITSADLELTRALQEVERRESRIGELRKEMDELNRKIAKQQLQIKELMHVNGQWDLEYNELQEAFTAYRTDSQRAQSENHALIMKLKGEKDELQDELVAVKRELTSAGSVSEQPRAFDGNRVRLLEREVQRLKSELKKLRKEGEWRGEEGEGGRTRIAELEGECELLKQQLTAYKEDFLAERRDRERLNQQQQTQALRYEAEITSLRLQLDRCRTELTHYSSETTKLAQQLRLKARHEEEQFRKHLESKGYLARSSDPTDLPTLDPFVEKDHEPDTVRREMGYKSPPYNRSSSRSDPHLYDSIAQIDSSIKAEGPAMPDARSNRPVTFPPSSSKAASKHDPAHFQQSSSSRRYRHGDHPQSQVPTSSARKFPNSAPPMLTNDSSSHSRSPRRFPEELVVDSNSNYHYSSQGRPHVQAQVPNGPLPIPRRQHPRELIIPGVSSALSSSASRALAADQQSRIGRLHNGVWLQNGTHCDRDALPPSSPPGSYGNPNVSHIPPMETKGKYICPRCARRFSEKSEYTEHKLRCLQ